MYEYAAVDFDGTLCTDAFPEIGEPKLKIIEFVRSLAASGSKIILHTCRENGTRKLLDEAMAFCEAHKIPIFAVNENPDNKFAALIGLKPSDSRKVLADLYIDDKAMNPAHIEQSELHGYWKRHMDSIGDYYSCNICEHVEYSEMMWCPRCLARMDKQQNKGEGV